MSAAPEPRPEPFSRRREVAATSARSLLLTVLGEFVLPRNAPVWTQTVVDVLALVGVEEKSARQALARTAADGVVTSTREGRRVHWSLSGSGRRLLTEGAARIYAHGAARPAWDGRWLVLVASVPEQQRQLRHQLRTRLAWAGLGSPSAGVWVCPDPGRLPEVDTVLEEVGLADQAFVVVGDYHGGPPHAELVDRAWNLSELEARYEAFVEQFADHTPADDDAALAAQTRLVDAWRRFPFLDPQLPAELLPPRWAGGRAAEVFHSRHAAWAPAARRAFDRLAAS
jgi:phenylacetic acid degradation operon negative regulatory protein